MISTQHAARMGDRRNSKTPIPSRITCWPIRSGTKRRSRWNVSVQAFCVCITLAVRACLRYRYGGWCLLPVRWMMSATGTVRWMMSATDTVDDVRYRYATRYGGWCPLPVRWMMLVRLRDRYGEWCRCSPYGADVCLHTPSIAFRHLPPNSAGTGYAAEGVLFISAQLSTDAASALRKVWVLTKLWKRHEARRACLDLKTNKQKSRLVSNDFVFVWRCVLRGDRASDWKARYITDMTQFQSPLRQGTFLVQSQLAVQTLWRVSTAPCVQSRASASVCMLKIPNTGSHTVVWTQKCYTHWQEWIALLLRLLCLTQKGRPWISCMGQRSTNIKGKRSLCGLVDVVLCWCRWCFKG